MLDQIIAEARKKKADRTLADQALVVRQDILSELAPPLWNSLRICIKAQCEKHSDIFCFEVHPSSMAIVRGLTSRKTLQIQYLEKSKRLHYQIGPIADVIRISLSLRDDAEFVDEENQPYGSVGHLAELLLTMLVA